MKPFASSFLTLVSLVCLASTAPAQSDGSWTFAVSGDSRNCGDVVMPAIARHVRENGLSFYWHLGDYRALYDFDQDLLAARHSKLTISDYQAQAWQDFIDQQIAPFGDLPVFLAIGNHELIARSRADVLLQFADWFDSPVIRGQRLSDDPNDRKLRGYYHWHQHNVDFINLDNASPEQFDANQRLWLGKVLKEDEADAGIRTIVVAMHDALPDSISAGHSMNESPDGTQSGRAVYNDLVAFRKGSSKEVQVLASHAHFVMSDVYQTACHKAGDVLPGWIVGTAGATRYRLPTDHAAARIASTDVYGYLLGTVSADGHVTFGFHPITASDVPEQTLSQYGSELVRQCFEGNKSDFVVQGPSCGK